ncbi:hypothetical protein K0038_04040 [Pseudomonas syringae]|nr:hypothetical protein [Pseudomonas syringae]
MCTGQLNLGFTNVYRCISKPTGGLDSNGRLSIKRALNVSPERGDERAETAYNMLWLWREHSH